MEYKLIKPINVLSNQFQNERLALTKNCFKKLKKKNGVTFLELLITIAITSIIAGLIAMPSMRGYQEGRANAAEILAQKIEMAKSEYSSNFPYSSGTVNGSAINQYFPGKDIPPPPQGFSYVEVEYDGGGNIIRETTITNPNTFDYVIGNENVSVLSREL